MKLWGSQKSYLHILYKSLFQGFTNIVTKSKMILLCLHNIVVKLFFCWSQKIWWWIFRNTLGNKYLSFCLNWKKFQSFCNSLHRNLSKYWLACVNTSTTDHIFDANLWSHASFGLHASLTFLMILTIQL